MTISNTTSIASFHQAISDAAVQRPTEEEAKLTKPEIKKAINLLPTTKAGVAAAVDVLENSTVRLTDGAKAHIQEFINAHQSAATEVVSDAPIFSSPLELRASLSSNSTDSIATLFGDTNYSRQMASQALADVGMAALSRADSVTLGDISDGPMGSFFVNIKISTFPNVNDI
ncbi:hypothetical protein KAI87_14665, partial [Myxococcota bacterium]|nr:hypothetical protein [Myxococcota bacterium]